jgi:glycosyltransferase involved in cell wall biosynthesis
MLSGQISSLIGLAGALRERGHAVQLVTAFAQRDLYDPDRLYAPEAKAGLLVSKLLRLPRVVERLQRAAADADVVQLNLPTPGFAVVGDLIQSMLNRPIIVGFETHLPSVGAVVKHQLTKSPRFYLQQLSVNNRLFAGLSGYRAARYVVASKLQADELGRLGVHPDRILVIPNVVDARPLDVDFEPGEVGWPAGSPIISYIGHFNHVKGVDVLVRAFPDVLRRYPGAQLVLAWSGLGASGPIQSAIRQAGIDNRVHLIGRLPVGGIVRRSDVFVLPYRLTMAQAAYPSMLLEALTIGVPLVTTDLPLLRELVGDGRTAELAEPDRAAAISQGILRLLDDPERGASMARHQRGLVQRWLSPSHLAARYEAMYESVINEGRTTSREASVLSASAGGGGV